MTQGSLSWLLACVAIGCSRTDGDTAKPPETPRPAATTGTSASSSASNVAEPGPRLQATTEPLPPCNDPDFEFKLKDQTQEQVLARFGPPSERESYRAIERGGEFYGAIEHAYPSRVPANRDVPIEEWTWTSGECILTVWFHRPRGTPIVLHDIYWHQDTAF